MKKICFSLLFGSCMLALVACGGKNNAANQRAESDYDDVMISDSRSSTPGGQAELRNDNDSQGGRESSGQQQTAITEGTYKYKKVKEVSPDGEVRSGGDAIFYLTYTDNGNSFYISNHDGSRSKENGGYASRYVPGGTGIANNFANPMNFRYDSTSGDYLVYASRRPITSNSDPNDVAGYTTDFAKMTRDKRRINVKIGDSSGYSVYYSSIEPFMTFRQGNWTVVLELVESGPSAEFY